LQVIYEIMGFLFPYSWCDYTFMKNAFIAILIIAPLFGLVGTMIVNNKMAFFSDALGHSALTGIAIGVMLGIQDPVIAMIAFGIIFAYAINKIKGNDNSSNDTIISVFSSTSIALGLALLSKGGNFNKYSSYLIGDILSINPTDLLTLVAVFVVIILFWIFFSNKLLLISIDSSLAKSKDIKVKLVENLFIIIIAVLVMISIKWVGILIINSLLILPAAASKNIAKNMRQYSILAVCFSIVSGLSGLIVSYYNGVATGPTIVIIAAIIYFITLIFKGKR
jgi:zinc transport system permease protein